MINANKKIKIALIGDSLSSGGAEKVQARLSVYFESTGIEVHHCIFLDKIEYKYAGTVFNLGKIKPNSSAIVRRPVRLKALNDYLNTNNFNYIIDFRMRTNCILETILAKLIYPKNTIYSVRSGILDYYFVKPFFWSKYLYQTSNILAVSKETKTKISTELGLKNVEYIYNPIDFNEIQQLQNEFEVKEPKYIVAAGRMNDTIKQFDKLIECYSKSILPKKGIKLLFLGEGENKIKLQSLAEQLGLRSLIEFKGFVENPFPYYKNALFTVLSSKNEGFPNVLIETLATQTPVIAFDCFSGPNEIIEHKVNGLLVENQNFDALTEAMNQMIEKDDLYQNCKLNAKESVRKFDVEIIGQQWQNLFKNVVS